MPYLNWKDAALSTQEVSLVEHSGPNERMRFRLGMSAGERDELLMMLRQVLEVEAAEPAPAMASAAAPVLSVAAELRLDLPRNWILFWKLRDGESRLLIAHPQQTEWVATAALNPEHAAVFLERFEALEPGQSLPLHELAPIGNVSNVEITLSLAN